MPTTAPSSRVAAELQQAALLAIPSDHRRRIAELLRGEGFEPIAVADAEHFDDCDPGLAVAIVWLQQEGSPLMGTVRTLAQRLQSTPIVALGAGLERWEIRAVLSAGARGVVAIESLETALCPCVRAVAAGMSCVPQAHSRQIEPPALSAREKQILGLVVMGYMNSQIAEQLFLAESTVKSHLSSAFAKLGVRSRNEAVGIILDPDNGLGLGILGLGGEPVAPASAPSP
jgi:DNA-binding NarL/FixJ family response regulator